MQKVLLGEIICKRVPYSRALSRFVEKTIYSWIEEQCPEISFKNLSFEVTFERNGLGHQFDCYTKIESDFGNHVAASWGNSPQEALKNCLQQMTIYATIPLQTA